MIPSPRLSDSDLRRFRSKVALPNENDCMLWMGGPYESRYGLFYAGGAKPGHNYGAHRISLLIAEGPPALDTMHAAHSCRDTRCVAPAHLSWSTSVDNEADKLRDGVDLRGERHHSSKLTEAQVLEIRTAKGSASARELARRYGVARSTIAAVHRGQNWAWMVDDPKRGAS